MKYLLTLLSFLPLLYPYYEGPKDLPVRDSCEETIVYLFPGQGSDYRIFKHLELPEGYDTVRMKLPVPARKESLEKFALRFVEQIDTTRPFVLMGVSLGGMICTELSDSLRPMATLIISSAKHRGELPGRYRFQRTIPLNRMVPANLTKAGALVLAGMVEPDRKLDRETFRSMLRSKDPIYLKRTVDMIIRWDRDQPPEGIFHLHGNHDHTLPSRFIECDYLIDGGTHSMMITSADSINPIIRKILEDLNSESGS